MNDLRWQIDQNPSDNTIMAFAKHGYYDFCIFHIGKDAWNMLVVLNGELVMSSTFRSYRIATTHGIESYLL